MVLVAQMVCYLLPGGEEFMSGGDGGLVDTEVNGVTNEQKDPNDLSIVLTNCCNIL